MQYMVNFLQRMAELDDYENGCDPHTGQSTEYRLMLTADSIEHLLQKVTDHFSIDRDSMATYEDETPGRLDIIRLEDDLGDKLSQSELEEWKAGNLKAYNATYTGYVSVLRPVELKGYVESV